MKSVTLKISDMTCEGCANAVRAALTGVAGVERAQVLLEEKRARVTVEDGVPPAKLLEAVKVAGYSASFEN